MTDHRDAAIHCEMKKYALRQTRDGIIVSFVLHPHEVPPALQTAEIGSRWMVALVELNDEEQPVLRLPDGLPNGPYDNYQPAEEHPEPVTAKAKGSWRDLTPTTQAAIRCADPVFREFLAEEGGIPCINEETAIVALRAYCGVDSRTQLSINHKAGMLWKQLDDKFQAWKLVNV